MTYQAAARVGDGVEVEARSVRQQLGATAPVTAHADQAYVREAIGTVDWQRSGMLGRLIRSGRAS